MGVLEFESLPAHSSVFGEFMKPELQKEICEVYKSGDSIRIISKKYSIPRSTVYDNLNKFGILRRHVKIIDLKDRNQLIIGALVGLWAGDGSRYIDKNGRFTVKIHLSKNDRNLIEFIKFLYEKLFGKEPKLYSSNRNGNSASLKIDSKFIYYFFDKYLSYDPKGRKVYTIRLKTIIDRYSKDFLKGFLLGLVLSDGYLKDCFCFATVSKGLAENIIETLNIFNYKTYCYLFNNRNLIGNWKPLYNVKIERSKVTDIKTFLNNTLRNMKIERSFSEIKYALSFMIDTEKRAELLRPKMMKDDKFLISRIEGTGQDPRSIDIYFRYYDYVDDETDIGKLWLKSSPNERWSPKFLGLIPDFKSRPIKEVKKLEFQNPAYSAAHRFKGDPKDFNRVFAVQVSGCTFACNFCFVPPEVNAANPKLGNFFSSKEIIEHFIKAREKSKESINVLRITGGEPTIIPEIIIEVYDKLEKISGTYLWIDTNLSIAKNLLKFESDLKDIMRKKNVGVVGCFKGFCKEDFSIVTGVKPEFYETQFETAKIWIDWKTDLYTYLPALVYRLQELNKNLPLRVEMLEIREMGGALINMKQKEKEGRPMPKTDQRIVFDLWYNKLLPKYYSKEMLEKFCCEVPLG